MTAVGDIVYARTMRYRNHTQEVEAKEYTVTRVGRVYAYVEEYGREVGFYLDNGVERTEYRPRRFLTRTQMDEQEQLERDTERLRTLAPLVQYDVRWFTGLPAEKRAAILTVLED